MFLKALRPVFMIWQSVGNVKNCKVVAIQNGWGEWWMHILNPELCVSFYIPHPNWMPESNFLLEKSLMHFGIPNNIQFPQYKRNSNALKCAWDWFLRFSDTPPPCSVNTIRYTPDRAGVRRTRCYSAGQEGKPTQRGHTISKHDRPPWPQPLQAAWLSTLWMAWRSHPRTPCPGSCGACYRRGIRWEALPDYPGLLPIPLGYSYALKTDRDTLFYITESDANMNTSKNTLPLQTTCFSHPDAM